MSLAIRALTTPPRGGAALMATGCFAAGLIAGALLAPGGAARPVEAPPPPAAALRSGHPAELIRVVDGDTFDAKVRIWPGMDVTTRVRLRGIDAPELKARCDAERLRALAARDALARMLAQGAIGVTRIGQDKYGGRVDADVSTARTPDVAQALVERGLARSYAGGRRAGWCGSNL